MEALPARQAPPHTTISRPVHTALAPWRPRSGPAAILRHPFGRAGPAPGSVGDPTIGPPPLPPEAVPPPDPSLPPDPPVPAPGPAPLPSPPPPDPPVAAPAWP